MNILILAEHHGQQLNPAVYQAVGAATFWGAPIDILVIGHHLSAVTKEAAQIQHVSRVLTCDAEHFAHALAEDVAKLIASIGHDYQIILAAHSAFSRNVLPRAAALLDVDMVSDVLAIHADNSYERAVYAGNVLTNVQNTAAIQIMTVHGSQFSSANKTHIPAEIVTLDAPQATQQVRWVSETRNLSERPPLSSAKVVVSGGRSLGSAEQFEQILAPLATKLGAALGATRAAVDAGFAPNDIQVGQTGVVVAPELYIAVGVSGAVQHTYGMKDSKVVVAINQDPDAPIFQIADYGLVADLFEVIPALTAAIQ